MWLRINEVKRGTLLTHASRTLWQGQHPICVKRPAALKFDTGCPSHSKFFKKVNAIECNSVRYHTFIDCTLSNRSSNRRHYSMPVTFWQPDPKAHHCPLNIPWPRFLHDCNVTICTPLHTEHAKMVDKMHEYGRSGRPAVRALCPCPAFFLTMRRPKQHRSCISWMNQTKLNWTELNRCFLILRRAVCPGNACNAALL